MKKRVCITGGAGFIGSYLSELLIQEGNDVLVLDNLSTGNNHIQGTRLVEGDIRSLEIVRKCVAEVDEVYHLAAVVGVKHCYEYPDLAYSTNITGTYNVLKSCIFYEKPLLFVSSASVYGKIGNKELKEDDNTRYGSPTKKEWTYFYQKALAENILSWYGNRGNPIKMVRLFNTIGLRQANHYGMVVSRFIEQAKVGKPLMVYGDGKQTRTFGDVRDIIKGLLLVMDKGKNGEAYNLGSLEEISIRDLAVKIKKMVNSKSEIVSVPYDMVYGERFEEVPRMKPSLEKIEKLGYKSEYSLDDTLEWIMEIYTIKQK